MSAIMDLYKELRQVDVQAKALAKRKAELQKQLADAIPEGYARDGVFCKVTRKSSVSYAGALKQIIEDLLPKTRHEVAQHIVAEHTKESVSVSFRPAEQGDPAPALVEQASA